MVTKKLQKGNVMKTKAGDEFLKFLSGKEDSHSKAAQIYAVSYAETDDSDYKQNYRLEMEIVNFIRQVRETAMAHIVAIESEAADKALADERAKHDPDLRNTRQVMHP